MAAPDINTIAQFKVEGNPVMSWTTDYMLNSNISADYLHMHTRKEIVNTIAPLQKIRGMLLHGDWKQYVRINKDLYEWTSEVKNFMKKANAAIDPYAELKKYAKSKGFEYNSSYGEYRKDFAIELPYVSNKGKSLYFIFVISLDFKEERFKTELRSEYYIQTNNYTWYIIDDKGYGREYDVKEKIEDTLDDLHKRLVSSLHLNNDLSYIIKATIDKWLTIPSKIESFIEEGEEEVVFGEGFSITEALRKLR